MTHWARAYITKPHARDADGPESYSCWGLVRAVFRERDGVHLPRVAVHEDGEVDDENVGAIKAAARLLHMRPIGAQRIELREMDIVLMQSTARLHCGIVIRANGQWCVLHSSHGAGVICERWSDAVAGMQVEIWRRA